VISINFLDDHYRINYVFMSNAKRYSQFFSKIYESVADVRLICTSNITETREKIDYIVNFATLVADEDVIRDNPLILFLHLLQKIGQKEVALAGFDGYVENIEDDYYKEYIPFLYDTNGVTKRNAAITEELKLMASSMEISSITPSIYLDKRES
jgi:4-hydroxy 2-oxovalerate aldolase